LPQQLSPQFNIGPDRVLSKQLSLLQFGLSKTAAHQKTGEADERRKRQRAAAEDLGLGWPLLKVPRKGAGRPRMADLWMQALVDAILQDRLPATTSRECPPWWRSGYPLVRTEKDVEADMFESIIYHT
jgi:hypothetical protein